MRPGWGESSDFLSKLWPSILYQGGSAPDCGASGLKLQPERQGEERVLFPEHSNIR